MLHRLVVLSVLLTSVIAGLAPPSTSMADNAGIRLTPEADTWVELLRPSTNHGSAESLLVDGDDGGNRYETYMRFVVGAVDAPIQRARLRLYAYDGSPDGPALYRTDNAWSETDLTWNNRPQPSGSPLGDAREVAHKAWLEYDVTSAVTGAGTYSFVLRHTSNDGVDAYSREGSYSPELILETEIGSTTGGDIVPTLLGTVAIPEGSGVVASQRYPGVLWLLSDSGPDARNRLTAIKLVDGRLVDLLPGLPSRTITVQAPNHDWEALALDAQGRLWIGDIGNNSCTRADLALLLLPEPDPYHATSVAPLASYPLTWPASAVSGACTGRDAEGLVVLDGWPYLLTKALRPTLYRPAQLTPGQPSELVPVAALTPPAGTTSFATPPTGADLSPDGRQLAVALEGERLVLYQAPPAGTSADARLAALVSQPPVLRVPYRADGRFEQVEGIAFTDASALVLLSESGDLRLVRAGIPERERGP